MKGLNTVSHRKGADLVKTKPSRTGYPQSDGRAKMTTTQKDIIAKHKIGLFLRSRSNLGIHEPHIREKQFDNGKEV